MVSNVERLRVNPYTSDGSGCWGRPITSFGGAPYLYQGVKERFDQFPVAGLQDP